MDAYKAVAKILTERLNCDASFFTPETNLEQLGIDSLENMEIVMELEDMYGMDLFPTELPCTVGDLVKLLPQD